MGGRLRLLPQKGPLIPEEFGQTPRYRTDLACVVMDTSRNVCEVRHSPVRLLYADLESV